MTTYTAICRRPTGELVTVEAPPLNQVRFNGAAVNVPKGLLHVRAAASDERMVAIGTMHNPVPNTPDRAGIVNDLGQWRDLCPSHGNQACEIVYVPGADWVFVAVVESATTYRRFALSPKSLMTLSDSGSIPYPPEAPPHSSQGFRDMDPDGMPVWYDDHLTPKVHDGIAFFRYMTRGLWTAGIVGRKNRVGLWDGTRAWISFATTQVQPRLEIDPHGHPYVAVSTDGGGHFLTLADFTGYDLPPKADLVPIKRPFLTGAYTNKDAKTWPGHVVIPIRASAAYKQWLIDNKIPILAPADDHAWVPKELLYGIYTGEDGNAGMSLPQAVAFGRPVADARGVGLFAFSEAEHPITSEIALIRPHDTYFQKAFLNHGESDEGFALRLSAASKVLKEKGVRTVLVVGCHQRRDDTHPTGLPHRPLCEVQIICSQLADRDQHVGAVSFRVWAASLPPAQRDDVAVAVEYARAWYGTATGLPTSPRPQPGPQPVPTPIPTPDPTPDHPNPDVPEEIDMIALGEPIKVSALGDPVLQSDGTIAIKKKNGKWLSLNSFGKFEERDGVGGDEKFIKGKNGLIATGRANETFIVPAVEG